MNNKLSIFIGLVFAAYAGIMTYLHYYVFAYIFGAVFIFILLAINILDSGFMKQPLYKWWWITVASVILINFLHIVYDFTPAELLVRSNMEKIVIFFLVSVSGFVVLWFTTNHNSNFYLKQECKNIRGKSKFKINDICDIPALSKLKHIFIDADIVATTTKTLVLSYSGDMDVVKEDDNTNLVSRFLQKATTIKSDDNYTYGCVAWSELSKITKYISADGSIKDLDKDELTVLTRSKSHNGLVPTIYYFQYNNIPEDKILIAVVYEKIDKNYILSNLLQTTVRPVTLYTKSMDTYLTSTYFSDLKLEELTIDNMESMLRRTNVNLSVDATFLGTLSKTVWSKLHTHIKFVYNCSDVNDLPTDILLVTSKSVLDRHCVAFNEDADIQVSDENILESVYVLEDADRIYKNNKNLETVNNIISKIFLCVFLITSVFYVTEPILLPVILILGFFKFILIPTTLVGSKTTLNIPKWLFIIPTIFYVMYMSIPRISEWTLTSERHRVIFTTYIFTVLAVMYVVMLGYHLSVQCFIVLISMALFPSVILCNALLSRVFQTTLLGWQDNSVLYITAIATYPASMIWSILYRRFELWKHSRRNKK